MAVAVTYTAREWADRLARPIKDRAYQSTRTGEVVAFNYLPWKRLRAAAKTLDCYERDLARGCLAFPDYEVKDWMAADLITVLNLFPPKSQKRALAAWRNFLLWASVWYDLPHLHRQLELLPKLKANPPRVYEIFTAAEQDALIRATVDAQLPKRDLLAMNVVFLGPRRGELQKLQLKHFNHASRTIRFHGKGDKERIVPFDDELYIALMDFLETPVPKAQHEDARGRYVQDRLPCSDDFLFFPWGSKADFLLWTDPARPMSETAMHRWWGRAVEQADVKYRSLHMNRHTAGTNLVEAGVDAFSVKDWLGHASVSTTEVYVHNARQRLRSASEMLSAYRKTED